MRNCHDPAQCLIQSVSKINYTGERERGRSKGVKVGKEEGRKGRE